MRKNIKQVIANYKHRGAVSLFVVIFSAFLFVAVTVGFTALMVSDQNRATDSDLAQSARDSAEAGIEEAKRVLAQLELCNQQGSNTDPNCIRIANAVSAGECGTIPAALGISPTNAETIIEKSPSSSDSQLEQAFTCVKINPDTLTYEGRLDGESDMRVVPIRATGDVSRIKVSWVQNDTTSVSSSDNISPSWDSKGINGSSTVWSGNPPKMPAKSEWNSYGSILRVGSYQYPAGEMNLTEIDNSSRTAFLYPTTSGSGGRTEFRMDDVDKHTHPEFDGLEGMSRISLVDEPNMPQNIRCNEPTSGNEGDFLCSATFDLAEPISSASGGMRTYLTLSSIYNSTMFRVQLIGSDGSPVRFQNVQPEIDATGRANNVLRRLVARVESADAGRAPYPRAALGSANSICKAYLITDSADEYTDYRDHANCPDITSPESP